MKKIILILVLCLSMVGANAAPVANVTTKVDSVLICKSKSSYAYHSY